MKTQRRNNLSLSKLQSPVTTQWLHNNYEMSEGLTLPRSSLYTHYLDFCSKNAIVPVNAASFGKIIRSTFPDLKTRRLGTRGQSKYHYYGIRVKKSSPYYEVISTNARQSSISTNQSQRKSDDEEEEKELTKTTPVVDDVNEHSSRQENPAPPSSSQSNYGNNLTPSGTLLPEFPSKNSLNLNDEVIEDKVKTFLIMYRAHCQRILDTILRANFAEVKNFLIHFWQGMPAHIVVILSNLTVIDLIGNCDNILYKAVSRVLIPGCLQPLPASLTQAIQQFAKQLPVWLEMALYHLPEELQNKKISVSKLFAQLLCRQTSLSHLAQASRTVLHNSESVSQMLSDLDNIKIGYIIKEILWISPQHKERDARLATTLFHEFYGLMEKQASIEEFTEWVASLVTRCVVKPSEKVEGSFQSLAQEFLLKWAFITSKIIQELTLRSAKSFGSFHLLQMLFDDYIFYMIESRADISEEVEETSVEKQHSKTKTFHGACLTSSNYVESFRSRHSSASSSDRGSISPPFLKTPSNFIPYVGGASNYNRPSYNNHNQFVFPYDDPTRSQQLNLPAQQKLTSYYPSQTFDQSNSLVDNVYCNTDQSNSLVDNVYCNTDQSDSYYSEDLEIVRQLQERTKSLMDATIHYEGETYNQQHTYHTYPQQMKTPSYYQPVAQDVSTFPNTDVCTRM